MSQPIAPRWELLAYQQLSRDQLFDILRLRQAVFVVEQNCVYPDIDSIDQQAWHLCGWHPEHNSRLCAYARVMAPGVSYSEASIGRVLTAPEVRGKGMAAAVMKEAMAFIDAEYPEQPIRIGAQVYLEAFYLRLGFKTVSAPYDEDGIMHVQMLYE